LIADLVGQKTPAEPDWLKCSTLPFFTFCWFLAADTFADSFAFFYMSFIFFNVPY